MCKHMWMEHTPIRFVENEIEFQIASTLMTMWLCRNEFTIRWGKLIQLK